MSLVLLCLCIPQISLSPRSWCEDFPAKPLAGWIHGPLHGLQDFSFLAPIMTHVNLHEWKFIFAFNWAACEANLAVRVTLFVSLCASIMFLHRALILHLLYSSGTPRSADFLGPRWESVLYTTARGKSALHYHAKLPATSFDVTILNKQTNRLTPKSPKNDFRSLYSNICIPHGTCSAS